MKIRDFKTFVVGNPPPQFGGRYWIFIKLVTDCGIVGYGEVYNATFGPHTTAAMIEDVCERHVVGHDPFKSENLFRKVYASGFNLRPDVSLMGVLSGIEMACWDIVGKALDQPVYNLLGGQVNEKLRSYTYIYPQPDDTSDVYRDPDLAASHAAELVEQGFTAVKFDPAGRYSAFDPRQPSLEAIERSVQFCKKIREAVGTKADLLFGTHGQFSPAGAIRLAKQLEPYDPLWFEEPCPPDNAKAMAQVSEHTSIPVATGERLTTKYEFLTVLENRSASILQMALGRVGGILEGKKIAAMAEAFHTQIAPHLYCGPIEAAANIQLGACSPNFLILESIQRFDGFHNELLKTPILWDSGYVIPPTAPGLGVELDEAVAERHPYNEKALHLEMASEPIVGEADI